MHVPLRVCIVACVCACACACVNQLGTSWCQLALSWYQLAQAGTSWYQLVPSSQLAPAGISWYQLGTSWYPDGTQLANQPEENVVRAVIVDETLLKNIEK